MDLNRQAETIMNLMAADYDAGGAVFRNFCVGQDSYLHTAWLWDGILLWTNDIHLTRLEYPVTLFDEDAYLLVNICHSGRCEVELSPGSFVYMSPGILNVSMNPPKSKYYYPGGIYKGIELCFDLRKMREQMPEALTSYGFDLSMLERFAGKGNVLAMMKSESVQEEEKLFDMLCEGKSSIYDIRFAILSLLHNLVNRAASGPCVSLRIRRAWHIFIRSKAFDESHRRFAIAHELGHFLLAHETETLAPGVRCFAARENIGDVMEDTQELETYTADLFAIRLLAPACHKPPRNTS